MTQRSGDPSTTEIVYPVIYCTDRFLRAEGDAFRVVDWNDVVIAPQNEDPDSPRDGQVWLRGDL